MAGSTRPLIGLSSKNIYEGTPRQAMLTMSYEQLKGNLRGPTGPPFLPATTAGGAAAATPAAAAAAPALRGMLFCCLYCSSAAARLARAEGRASGTHTAVCKDPVTMTIQFSFSSFHFNQTKMYRFLVSNR